jgi:benzodiazapine receptor
MLGRNSTIGALRWLAILLLPIWLLLLLLGQVDGFSLADSATTTRRTENNGSTTRTAFHTDTSHLLSNKHRFPIRLSRRRSSLFAEPEEESPLTPPAPSEPEQSDDQTTTTTTTMGGVDVAAIFKYGAAIAIQMSLVAALFQGLDRLVVATNLRIPFAVNAMAMYVLALKSRVFNPLSNQRPQPKSKEIEGAGTTKRTMPTWTPPGVVFPIVWLLLIGPLRAVTSAMVIRAAGGVYATKALLALVLHLSIGDVWNTINNVEQRYGTSVLGILFVWASAAWAARQYYLAVPLAGKLLSLKLIWLTVATSLITRTWQLNPKKKKDEDDPRTTSTGNNSLAPLLPTQGDGETNFQWFGGSTSSKKE